MTGCPTREQLESFLAGSLSGAEEEAVCTHVDGCATCQAALDTLVPAGPMPRAPDPVLNEEFLARLKARPPAPGWSAPTWATLTKPGPGPAGEPILAIESHPMPRIPGYEVIEELGRGGMGVVYKARQVNLNRMTAVKMVLAGGHAERDTLVRFRAEAEAVAALHHPNIVQVYEVGEYRGSPFFSMEYVPGGTLRHRLRGGLASPREAAELVATLAGAVQYAHDRGIIHRDLKPANILLSGSGKPDSGARADGRPSSSSPNPESRTPNPVPKIADFGLAKRLDDGLLTLTQTGRVLGTPSYMAPEQAAGKGNRAGPGVDTYALGAILYEMLTGRPPFLGESFESTLNMILNEEPTPPRRLRAGIPRDLETVCLKCLEKDPHRRYASAGMLADDLGRFLAGEPVHARPVGALGRGWRWSRRNPVLAALWGGFIGALVLGLAGVSWKWREAEAERRKVEAAEKTARDERDESRRLTAGMLLDKGIDRAEKGNVAEGLFWMLAALQTAPEDDHGLRRAARLNLAAWQPLAHRLRQALAGEFWGGAVAPDGRRFVTLTRQGEVQLWDAATGRPVGSPGRVPPNPGGLSHPTPGTVAFAPDGASVVACGGAVAQRFDSATGAAVGAPLSHPEWVHAAAFSPDGRRVATACEDGAVRLWDAATGEPLGEPFRDAATHPISLAFSPDGTALAVGTTRSYQTPRGTGLLAHGGRDLYDLPAAAHLMDLATGKPRSRPLPHNAAVNQVLFTGDGRHLLTACSDWTVRLWDPAKGELVGPPMPHAGQARAAVFTPDGTAIATGDGVGPAGGVQWWDAATHRPLVGTRPRMRGSVFGLSFAADGQTLAVVVGEGEPQVRLWQVARPLVPPPPARTDDFARPADGGPDHDVRFSPDGRTALSWDTAGPTARLWDATTARPRGVPDRHPWAILTAAFSPDGTRAAVSSIDKPSLAGASISSHCEMIDAASGRVLFTVPSANWVNALAFTPDGKVLATGGYDRHVHLWDAATGGRLGAPWRQKDIVEGIAFSPDGRTLAVSHYGDDTGSTATTTWDVATRQPRCPEVEFHGCYFSPDGRLLASGWATTRVRLWDAATGQPAGPALETNNPNRAPLVFSPDGQLILTDGPDGTTRLWEVGSGRQVGTPMPYPHRVTARAFAPDGRLLLLGYADGAARLWDVATHKPVGPPVHHTRPVRAVAFTADGRTFLTAAADGVPHAWPVPEPQAEPDPERVRLRLEVRTGLTVPQEGVVAELSPADWQQRRDRLAELEGSAESADAGDPDDRAWHDARARDAEAGGQTLTATWHLDRLAAADPADWRPRARRARAYSDTGQFDKADAEYAEVLRLGGSQELLAWYRHRTAECESAGRWEAALWYLNRTVAAEPNAWDLYATRAAVHDRLRREAERDADLDRAVALGAPAPFLIRFAAEDARRGRWERVIDYYSRAGVYGPLSSVHHLRHAVARLWVSDPAGYRRVCRELLAAAGPEPDFASCYMVVWASAIGPSAVDDYAPVLRLTERLMHTTDGIHRRRAIALQCLGAVLCRAGRYREAIERLNEAAAADDGSTALRLRAILALAHHGAGDTAGARKWLGRVPAYTPTDGALDWDLLEAEILRREAAAAIGP
jgi:serine/threonine protein kinase/WD40 repeat protein/Flp pilus assembly protein TadD